MGSAEKDADQFVHEVRSAFNFLLADHGFQETRETPRLVEYQSSRVFIKVYHERYSEQVGIVIGLLDRPNIYDHGLGHIIAVVNSEAGWSYRDPSSRPPNTIGSAVAEVAERLRSYGTKAVTGDEGYYDTLGSTARGFAERRMQEQRIRRTKRLQQ